MSLFPMNERFSIYQPAHVVADDLNILPTRVKLVGTGVEGNLQRGGKAQDAATSVGVYGQLAARAFFQPERSSLLKDRGVILDEQRGEAWLIHSVPALRTHFSATAHVECLCTILPPAVWPEGISAAAPGNTRRR